jgi:hypothetical protein
MSWFGKWGMGWYFLSAFLIAIIIVVSSFCVVLELLS